MSCPKTHNHILPFQRSLFFCTFLLTNANGAAFQRIAESLDCNCNFVTNIGLGSLKSVRMISIFSQTRQYKYGGWDDALVQFGQTPCACWLASDRWHWHWHWLHWRRYWPWERKEQMSQHCCQLVSFQVSFTKWQNWTDTRFCLTPIIPVSSFLQPFSVYPVCILETFS